MLDLTAEKSNNSKNDDQINSLRHIISNLTIENKSLKLKTDKHEISTNYNEKNLISELETKKAIIDQIIKRSNNFQFELKEIKIERFK